MILTTTLPPIVRSAVRWTVFSQFDSPNQFQKPILTLVEMGFFVHILLT
jgi:hypothetical protein